MTNDIHQLAAPYALHALDDAERHAFEAHLATCADCREEIQILDDGASLFGVAAEEPVPAGMRERVLAQVDATPQDRSVVALGRRRFSPTRIITSVAAAVVLVAGIAFGFNALTDGTSPDDVLAAADVVTTELAATEAYGAGPVSATIAYSPSQRSAVVTFDGLADVSDDQTYELWVVDGTEVLRAGLFRPGKDGRVKELVEGKVAPGVTIAVTVEPAGGVDVATGEILFAGSI